MAVVLLLVEGGAAGTTASHCCDLWAERERGRPRSRRETDGWPGGGAGGGANVPATDGLRLGGDGRPFGVSFTCSEPAAVDG